MLDAFEKGSVRVFLTAVFACLLNSAYRAFSAKRPRWGQLLAILSLQS